MGLAPGRTGHNPAVMNLIASVWRGLWRALFFLLGLALTLWMLLLALGIGLVALVWALLRGRRPAPVRFQWQRGPWTGAAPGRGAAPGEVVDVQAREVPETSARLDRPATPDDRP